MVLHINEAPIEQQKLIGRKIMEVMALILRVVGVMTQPILFAAELLLT